MASTFRSRRDDHNAGRRARELYRYFQPERLPELDTLSVNNVPITDNFLPPATAQALDASIHASSAPSPLPPPPPQLSPPLATTREDSPLSPVVPETLVLGQNNATLTSFAQLAALRLNVERVIISVSDRDSQFILAQASQSPVGSDARAYEAEGDGIWSGCSTLPSCAWGMCEATVALPPSSRDPKEYSFLVVNDLQESESYKNIPFVTDGPRFRFYAGTPLTTETKINIGCFFALDAKPRDNFSDLEKEILGSLGMLIMDYLQVSRQASEGRRAARLSRGLSYFVEGSSSFVDSQPSCSGSSAPTLSTPASSAMRANHLSAGSWAFRRAANLLRESLELDADGGVIFLEVTNSHMLDFETGSDCSGETGPAAPVLAVSTRDEPFAPGPGSTVLYPAANLDSGFLHQLLRRYTKGKLWSFHRDGILSSSDDEKPNGNRSMKPAEPPRGSGKKWKQTENAMLNLFFPNATQVMFVPLWNAANSQWFAGCFCWNTVETRVFSPSVELSSVLGFGSSIMAECNRVQSLISDRQKGDFIGSISPLHGILAATEFLHSTDLDEFQLSLLETINACGRTLLDTMNQVLDFSKIISLERTWRQLKRNNKTSPAELTSMDKISAHLDTFITTDLAVLAEEVVEGVCLGHTYGQKSVASSEQSVLSPNTAATLSLARRKPKADNSAEVEVVMDIAQNDWVYRTQPGALRRIIMNVFGNAMKYTESGRVSVHLEVTEASESRSRRHGVEELVTLTVSDTGKGISEAFLRGRLFTPFAQEDTLAVGTGLGLSIVRSLVKALNGIINVHSRPGEGTTVKVSLPLTRPDPEDSLEDSLPSRQDDTMNEAFSLRNSHGGRRVAIFGVEPADACEHRFWSIIARYLTDWYGLELVSLSSQEPIDVLLADEDSLASISKEAVTGIIPSLLILCNKSVDYSAIRAEWSPIAALVDIIRRPCGPHKLARCIRKCLDNGPRGGATLPPRIELPERPRMSNGIPPPCADLTEADPLAASGDRTRATSFRVGTLSSSEDSGESQSSSDIADALHGSDTSMSPLPTPSETASKRIERKARVLVVDDNSINLNLMLTFMKKQELEVLDSAENGKVAVDAVERMQQGYDLIFMDISMPVMNGFEATRAIRALEKERDGCGPATIIALTGLSSSRDASEALTSGVDLFLTKPVSFKEVSRLLDEWAERGLRDRKSPSPSPSAS
ncbi:sensor histidine kinase/response regulator [Aspergillus fumigatus Z5]|nr:sensor histidine kinase/response regulator [Aspergillus fumigatus Z5]